jgi:hypothetical protein
MVGFNNRQLHRIQDTLDAIDEPIAKAM